MASGHKHWRARLARLSREPELGRSARRQLRKLLGRALGVEWRVLGSRAGAPRDALNEAIAESAAAGGHLADRLRGAK